MEAEAFLAFVFGFGEGDLELEYDLAIRVDETPALSRLTFAAARKPRGARWLRMRGLAALCRCLTPLPW